MHEQTRDRVRPEDIIPTSGRSPGADPRVASCLTAAKSKKRSPAEPDISAIWPSECIMAIVEHDGRDLLAANLLLQAGAWRPTPAADPEHARPAGRRHRRSGHVASGRRSRAQPLAAVGSGRRTGRFDQHGARAARVYRQAIDLETASRLVAELGKNLVAILGTSAAAPAVGTAVAASENRAGRRHASRRSPAGTRAGVVTRWIGGCSLFISAAKCNSRLRCGRARPEPNGTKSLGRRELAQLVKSGIARLGGKSS